MSVTVIETAGGVTVLTAGAQGPEGVAGAAGPNSVGGTTATTLTGILRGDGSFVGVVTVGAGLSFAGGTLAASGSAADLTSGTLADARLSANVPLKNAANTFTGNQTVSTGSGVPLTVNTTVLGVAVQEWKIGGTLQASVNSSGQFSGSGAALTALNASALASGTVPAGRMPALTGDVTTSAGAVATAIANDAVTYAKLQNVSATQRVIGRNTAGAGDPEEVTASQVLDWVSSTANRIPYRGASAWATGAGLTYDGTTLAVRDSQEWRKSDGTLYACALPGAVDTGLDDGYWCLSRGGREYRVGSYNAAGAMVFKRSDVANYLGFLPSSTNVSFFTQAGMLILGAGPDAGSRVILTPNAGGGAYPVQFGRRHYDNHPAVGAAVEFWPVTGQTAPAAATVSPGGGTDGASPVAYRIGLMADGTVRLHDASSTTAGRAQADIVGAWATSTDATRAGRLTLSAYYTTTAQEGLRVDGDSGGVRLGFFGGAAAAKPAPTGSRGGNAALASLLTALASLGLITDSTSA